MSDQNVRDAVQSAVSQAWDRWAEAHPNLAGSIDRLGVVGPAAQALRSSPAYAKAVREYHSALSRIELVAQLAEPAAAIISAIMGS